jgi:hypothetical protein
MIAVHKELKLKIKVSKLDKNSFKGTVIETGNEFSNPLGSYGITWNKDEFNLIEETSEINTPKHYDNSKGSLYKFANEQGLNSWEFDLCKRIIRCRKKGNFKEDLEKTKFLIDLYLKEFNENSL